MVQNTIMPAFYRFPEVSAYIGRLLSGYGELEYQLQNCASVVLKDEGFMALRAMFVTRGEANRIAIAGALMGRMYYTLGLKDPYDKAIDAIDYCRKIRNQYSHCHWVDDDKHLFIIDLEHFARQPGKPEYEYRHIDATLLAKQEAYFAYTSAFLDQLSRAGKAGMLKNAIAPKVIEYPAKVVKPPKFTPPEKAPKYSLPY